MKKGNLFFFFSANDLLLFNTASVHYLKASQGTLVVYESLFSCSTEIIVDNASLSLLTFSSSLGSQRLLPGAGYLPFIQFVGILLGPGPVLGTGSSLR